MVERSAAGHLFCPAREELDFIVYTRALAARRISLMQIASIGPALRRETILHERVEQLAAGVPS